MDITIQYSPELLELLIDAIPRLCLTGQDVLIFFHENGVGYQYLSDLWLRVEQNDDNIQKDEIVRTALTRLNEQGESKFQQRKIILERVKKTCDFSQCLPSDQLKIKELVPEIQENSQVNNNSEIKTSFTAMLRKLVEESTKRQEEHNARIKEFKKKQEELESIKNVIFKIVTMPHGQWQESSEQLNDCINRLFKAYDINISKPYEFVNQEEESNSGDLTGIVKLDDHPYFLDIIWRDDPLGKTEISSHLVTLFQNELAGGIYISKSGYTHPAIKICEEALSQKIIILCELKEILFLLENKGSFFELLKSKIKMAVLEKQPLFNPPGYVQPKVSRYSRHHASSESKLIAKTF